MAGIRFGLSNQIIESRYRVECRLTKNKRNTKNVVLLFDR